MLINHQSDGDAALRQAASTSLSLEAYPACCNSDPTHTERGLWQYIMYLRHTNPSQICQVNKLCDVLSSREKEKKLELE